MSNQNKGKVEVDPLTVWMDANRQQPLRMADDAEVEKSLRRLLNEQSAMSTFDSERIMKAAWVMAQANKWTGPSVSIAWLTEQPSSMRLCVVLSLLLVAWNSLPDSSSLDPILVEDLLSVCDNLNYDINTENILLMVLIVVCKSELPAPLLTRIKGIIEHARNNPERAPEIITLLDTFSNKNPT